MKYEKKIAEELGKRYNLSPYTLKLWSKTGFIPDKYFTESKIKIQGYSLREARSLCQMDLNAVAEKLRDLIVEATGQGKEDNLRVQTLGLWELGKNKPNFFFTGMLEKLYAHEFTKRGIRPKYSVHAGKSQ